MQMERISGSTSLQGYTKASRRGKGNHLTQRQTNTDQYLFRKTPLKMTSIMLSTSALFSCSFEATEGLHSHQFDFCYIYFPIIQKRKNLTSVIFFCILSSCVALFWRSVLALCTSYSFWLFSALALRFRATPTRALSSLTAKKVQKTKIQEMDIAVMR